MYIIYLSKFNRASEGRLPLEVVSYLMETNPVGLHGPSDCIWLVPGTEMEEEAEPLGSPLVSWDF